MSVDELVTSLRNFSLNRTNSLQETKMDPNVLQNIVTSAVNAVVEQTKRDFEATVKSLTERLNLLETPKKVEEFSSVEIVDGVECDEPLDIVKSIPEFSGDAKKYVSWRQAAITAHKLFEPYEGSTKYYQVVAIIRNKVVGSADTVLSSYNTVLNFRAILARLDFSFGDKRSIYTLEQEMSTLKQGGKTIEAFYDEVEQKLTLIINKVLMTNEGNDSLIKSLNEKYRGDALRVFVSGVRKPMCDVLFSCKPADMPSALALAQELETNNNRYHFASAYWGNKSGSANNSPHYQKVSGQKVLQGQNPIKGNQVPQKKFENGQQKEFNNGGSNRPETSQRQNVSYRGNFYQQRPEAMDVDRSQRTNVPQNFKRPYDSDRAPLPKLQRVNNLSTDQYDQNNPADYANDQPHEHYAIDNNLTEMFRTEQEEVEAEEHPPCDEINFLEVSHSSHM